MMLTFTDRTFSKWTLYWPSEW